MEEEGGGGRGDVTKSSLSQKNACHLVVSRKFLQRLTEFQGWTKKIRTIFFALTCELSSP